MPVWFNPTSLKDVDWKKAKPWIITGAITFILLLALVIFLLIYFFGGPTDYQTAGLKAHNCYREMHHMKPLVLSSEATKRAEQCAKYYAKNDIDHSCPYSEGFGENVQRTSDGLIRSEKDEVEHTIQRWYDEVTSYDFITHSTRDGIKVDEFSQIVWKDTKQLGVGYARGERGYGSVVVCLYYPPGNVRRDNAANVFPSLYSMKKHHGHTHSHK